MGVPSSLPGLSNKKIGVPVLWDGTNNFRDNKTYMVSVESIIYPTYVPKQAAPTIPGYAPEHAPINTLLITDPTFGPLYLSLTLEEYLELVGQANASTDGSFAIDWLGGTDVPAGDVITSPLIASVVILSINKGGTVIYPNTYTYTSGSPDGTLDITLAGGLSEGEYMQLIVKNT